MEMGNSILTLRADIFNLFDADEMIQIDEVADEESGVPAATFGVPRYFQSPRSIRLGLTWDFTL